MNRTLFAVGFILIAVGLGTMEYAKEQRLSVPDAGYRRLELWKYGRKVSARDRITTYHGISGSELFALATISLSIGAGLVAFAVFPMFPLRTNK